MSKEYNIENVKPFIIDKNDIAYKIEKGSANVYISEFVDNKPMFRLFIKEVKEGDIVSGLNKKEEGSQFKMFLINSSQSNEDSVSQLKISTLPSTEKIRNKFLDSLNILLIEDTYEDNLIQHYLLDKVKESRNVYSEHIANVSAVEETYKNIQRTLKKQRYVSDKAESYTSNLYFALAKICYYMRIKHISYSNLNNFQRANLTIDIFSSYSDCTYRRVNLEDDWYKHDLGNFLAYTKDDKVPVACIYKRNSYYVISKENQHLVKVTKDTAQNISDTAYVIYRTFPERGLNFKDIIYHIKNSISIANIINVAIFAMLLSLIGMLMPLMNQLIYDKLIPDNDISGILECGLVLVAMIAGNASFSVVKGFTSFSLSSKIKYSLQIAFFDRVFKLKHSFLKKYEPANLSMIILGIGSIFTSLTTTTIASVLTFVFGFLYLIQMFSFMPNLCASAIIMLFLIFILLMVFARIQYKWYRDAVDLDIEKSSWLFQIIRGIDKLRITGAEDRASKKYVEKYSKFGSLNYKSGYYTTLISIISTMFSSVLVIVIYTLIYLDGLTASVGLITGFMSAYAIFSSAVLSIPSVYASYLKAKPWFERLKPIANQTPEKFTSSSSFSEIDGSIDVVHVSFAYDKSGPLVLDDVSFSVKSGEYVGIVGESGCGKTTLLNLLLGFEHQDKGKIFYGTHDLDELNKIELRQQFGVVLQDGDLISGSIYDNIAITNPDSNIKDVEDALEKVDLLDEVNNMPMRTQTILSEGSGMISGGQKQRILIARAIIGNPKIIFFDEATSSLDNISQAHICKSLDKIGCTRVVIAHRLSTVINCDKIIVFNQGRIVEIGTYESLMNEKGLFYKLAKRQIA